MQKDAPRNRKWIFLLSLIFAGSSTSQLFAQGQLWSWGDDGDVGTVSGTPSGSGFAQVATGSRYSVALREDGRLVGWGSDVHGLVSDIPADAGFIRIAVGSRHALALRADGSIATWGSGVYGLSFDAPTEPGFVQITGGRAHSLALRSDGTIVAWGDDGGQWDLGVFYPYGIVNDAPTGAGFRFIAAGDQASVALRSNGSMVAWGHQWSNTGIVSPLPAGSGYIEVSCAVDHALALRGNGTLAAWGNLAHMDFHGLVANMPSGSDFVHVYTGSSVSGALRADGTLEVWGDQSAGGPGIVLNAPTGNDFVDVSLNGWHAVVVRGTSEWIPFCFGDGMSGTCACLDTAPTGQGCLNSSGAGAILSASGMPSFSADSFQLHVIGVPVNKPGLILRGNNQVALPAGDGILCTAGGSSRSQVQVASGGATTFADFQGAPFSTVANNGSPTNFQFWYRDPANNCSGAGFNLSNGVTVTYLP